MAQVVAPRQPANGSQLRGLVVAQLVIHEPLDSRRERRALVDMITAYVDGATA